MTEGDGGDEESVKALQGDDVLMVLDEGDGFLEDFPVEGGVDSVVKSLEEAGGVDGREGDDILFLGEEDAAAVLAEDVDGDDTFFQGYLDFLNSSGYIFREEDDIVPSE